MTKSKNKTIENTKDVAQFLKSIEDPKRKKDCLEVNQKLKEISITKAKMWGSSIVGFG